MIAQVVLGRFVHEERRAAREAPCDFPRRFAIGDAQTRFHHGLGMRPHGADVVLPRERSEALREAALDRQRLALEAVDVDVQLVAGSGLKAGPLQAGREIERLDEGVEGGHVARVGPGLGEETQQRRARGIFGHEARPKDEGLQTATAKLGFVNESLHDGGRVSEGRDAKK